MREFFLRNIKVFIVLGVIMLFATAGVTLAVRMNDIGVVINTGEYNVVYTGTATLPSSKLTPIYDTALLDSSNASKIMKVEFTVKGAQSNPSNKKIIYDVSLSDLNLPLTLRSEHLKWRLYKNNSLLSSGSFSTDFDALVDNRMVLTETQQDLPKYSSSADSYAFYIWLSEPCVGDISQCNIEEHNTTPFLNHTFSGKIRIELSTESKKQLVREKGFAWSNDSITTLTNLGLDGEYKGRLSTFTNTSKLDGTTGIYSSEDDLGRSYYFRGNVVNNYVKFGKNASNQDMWWRIVRINGDGTVRMIYDGTSVHANNDASEDKHIGTGSYNTNNNYNAYIGYMYGTPNSTTYKKEHENLNDSNIKNYIDDWYEDIFLNTTYEQYIADAIYCNDRTISVGRTNEYLGSNNTPMGFANNVTLYSFHDRITYGMNDDYGVIKPTFKCEQVSDRFTKNGTIGEVKGNGNLTYPIAMITASELTFGGGYLFQEDEHANEQSYLYNGGYWYWTMTPYGYTGSSRMFIADLGSYSYDSVTRDNFTIRPVISLSSTALRYGSGSAIDPFRVIE